MCDKKPDMCLVLPSMCMYIANLRKPILNTNPLAPSTIVGVTITRLQKTRGSRRNSLHTSRPRTGIHVVDRRINGQETICEFVGLLDAVGG